MRRVRRVLFVVDDDHGMLPGVKRLLREHGYDSVLFGSAEAVVSGYSVTDTQRKLQASLAIQNNYLARYHKP
jgi:FixJ family two-component response regulator